MTSDKMTEWLYLTHIEEGEFCHEKEKLFGARDILIIILLLPFAILKELLKPYK